MGIHYRNNHYTVYDAKNPRENKITTPHENIPIIKLQPYTRSSFKAIAKLTQAVDTQVAKLYCCHNTD